MNVDLRCGDVREVLAQLKAEGVKVRTVITSPPYWGLRAYGTHPQVWSNGHAMCIEHEWATESVSKSSGYSNKSTLAGFTSSNTKGRRMNESGVAFQHDTCIYCGAWRGELGLEPTPELYVTHLVEVFRAVRDILMDDGTLWLNLGDSYVGGKGASGAADPLHQAERYARGESLTRPAAQANGGAGKLRPTDDLRTLRKTGLKPKDLVGIPWMVAFALRADGWYLRSDIIWGKKNPMPESVTDRCTKSHEYLFLLSKSPRYYYDSHAIAEVAAYDGRKDTMMKGSAKYANGHAPSNPNSMHVKGHERWSENEEGEKIRNKRSVWTVSTAQFDLNMCTECETIYNKKTYKRLATHIEIKDEQEIKSKICKCGHWDKWLSHFATFPPDLITPCVLAGSSEKGQCPKCGKAWVRVVERTKYTPDIVPIGTRSVDESRGDKTRKLSGKEYNEQSSSKTLGWKPSCHCGLDPIPDTVLDIFMGSGTTAEVAILNNRSVIGIELNPDYLKLEQHRVAVAMKAVERSKEKNRYRQKELL